MKGRSLHRVVILGAGFAGLRVAKQLAKAASRQHLAITLVNRTGVHAFTPSFYALAGTTTDSERHQKLERVAATPIARALAGLPVSLLIAVVAAIDDQEREVRLGDGRVLRYDTLVVALGSEPAYYGIPGLKEHAVTLKTLKDAETVSRKISILMRGRAEPVRIVVGGGGSTGVELSAMLAETVGTRQAGARITLLEAGPNVLNGFDEKIRTYVRAELERRQVIVRAGSPITALEAHQVVMGDETVPYDLFVWTGGIQSSPILSTLPYVVDHGRLATDAPLSCVPTSGATTDRHVYAIGDATCFHYGERMAPWTAQVAIQQADAVAKNIIRTLHGQKPKPFKLKRQIVLIPLGKNGGAGSFKGIRMKGGIVQLLNRLAMARHMMTLLPFWTGIRMALRGW